MPVLYTAVFESILRLFKRALFKKKDKTVGVDHVPIFKLVGKNPNKKKPAGNAVSRTIFN